MKWAKQSFDIATEKGARSVDGHVSGPWGLHESPDGRWVVTHLPSGMVAGRGWTKAKAMRLAAVMREAVPDEEWAALRNDSPAKIRHDIGARVMAALAVKNLDRGADGGPHMRKRYRLNGYAR